MMSLAVLDLKPCLENLNQGLGKKLLDSVVDHPQLQAVESFELYCLPEMVPFYERRGFTAELGGIQIMLYPKRHL